MNWGALEWVAGAGKKSATAGVRMYDLGETVIESVWEWTRASIESRYISSGRDVNGTWLGEGKEVGRQGRNPHSWPIHDEIMRGAICYNRYSQNQLGFQCFLEMLGTWWVLVFITAWLQWLLRSCLQRLSEGRND